MNKLKYLTYTYNLQPPSTILQGINNSNSFIYAKACIEISGELSMLESFSDFFFLNLWLKLFNKLWLNGIVEGYTRTRTGDRL